MAKWARIEDGAVAETTIIDPSGRFHTSLVWVPCADSVVVGMAYANGTFGEPSTTVDIAAYRSGLVCGPLQFRKALRAAGLHAAAVAYVNGADEETQEAWEYAGEFKRLDPFILAAQVALDKTDEEVDALFQLALTF